MHTLFNDLRGASSLSWVQSKRNNFVKTLVFADLNNVKLSMKLKVYSVWFSKNHRIVHC